MPTAPGKPGHLGSTKPQEAHMLEFTTWEAWKKATEERGLIIVQGTEDCDVENGPTGDITPAEAYDPKFCTLDTEDAVYDPMGSWGFYDYTSDTGFLYESDGERSAAWLGDDPMGDWHGRNV